MNRLLLVLLSALVLAACGGGGSSDTGTPDTSDVGIDTAEPQEEIVVKECTKADDCLSILGEPGQCEDLVCDEADWTCKRQPKEAGTKCSDGDPCTKNDACDDAGACQAGADECECRSTEECASKEDGDLCNGTLKCDVGSLPFKCVLDTTTVVTCSHAADTQCAATQCVPETGECLLTPVEDGTGCDDGDECSDPDTCQSGECKGAGLGCDCKDDLECLPFDDGDLCTGYFVCDRSALPYACVLAPGSVVTCSPVADTDCQKNQCEPTTGNCQMGPAEVGTPCDDGNFCTDVDGCTVDLDTGEGVCKGGQPHDCDDKNVCTNDGCDKIGQKCTYVFNNGPCEDFNKCLGGDSCQYGICLGGNLPVNCDDQDACTADSCETAKGCLHVAKDCTDGDPCTVDLCDAVSGACTYKPFLCGDGDLCTIDSCQPGVGCAFTPKDCADADLCTTDSCDANSGACLHAPVVCDDPDPCTVDACDPSTGGCVSVPKDCDDADLCTADSCDGLTGTCLHDPVALDDADACTADACDPVSGAITHVAKDCGDGVPCTLDLCDPLTAECSNPAVDVDDANACTADACTAETGEITHEPKDCGDGDLCTADLCDPLTAECSNPAVVCDDANVCTVDACDPGTGLCAFDAAAADGAECDDGYDFTTADACDDGDCLGAVDLPDTIFRVTSLQIEGPSFVADLGNGPVELNEVLGARMTALLGAAGYGESLLRFSPLPPVFDFDRGTLAMGRGACLVDTEGVATHCGILPQSDVSAWGPLAYDDLGACSADPAVEAPCYVAPPNAAAPVAVPVFGVQALASWTTGHFAGASLADLPALDGYLIAFVSMSDLAALPLQDAASGLDILAADALAHLTPDVFDGVDGFWLRLRFSAETVPSYAAGVGCNVDGAGCDDASLCTDDACDIFTGACVFSPIAGVDDGDPCTVDACDPLSAAITHAAKDCDDLDACTADACNAETGACENVSKTCDDLDACTADSCDPQTGDCLFVAKTCDDQSACTSDACDPLSGECVFTSVTIDDGDLCTFDACDPLTGLVTNDPKNCVDLDACTVDSCDPFTGECANPAKNCNDDLLCTTDSCDAGTGDCLNIARVCNDGNACTADACNPADGECVAPAVDDGLTCDDGNATTIEDACTGGVCAGWLPPPMYVRSRLVTWDAPDLTWNVGNGPEIVNEAVGKLATQHIVDGQYLGEPVPTPIFGVDPFYVGYPTSRVYAGYGTCDDLAMPVELTCTLDATTFPMFNLPVSTWATSGSCSDDPAVAAPCLMTDLAGPTLFVFGSSLFSASGLQASSVLAGDPVDGVQSITLHAFIAEAHATTVLSVSAAERVPLASLLANVPTVSVNGLTGWWIRATYVTEPFGILGH